MREGRKCRGREKRGGLALEKQNLKQRERRMNPELQLLLTRGFQGLPLIWDRNGHQSLLLGAERVCQLGLRSAFSCLL